MTAGKRERRGFLRQKMVWRQRMGGCESNPQTQNNENENSLEKEEDSHKAIMEKTLTLHAGESPKESNPPKYSLEKAKERKASVSKESFLQNPQSKVTGRVSEVQSTKHVKVSATHIIREEKSSENQGKAVEQLSHAQRTKLTQN